MKQPTRKTKGSSRLVQEDRGLGVWSKRVLSSTILLVCSASVSSFAAVFNVGGLEGQVDSTVSVGISKSTSSRDDHLIGVNNGGTGSSTTGDNGRLNFDEYETFSKIIKGSHDLELKYGDSGAFFRGKYWYDFELKDEDRPFQVIDDNGREQEAQSSGATLLDAFVYHNYSLKGLPGTVRFGKQVVSWGESTFIGGGLNSINPIDVSSFRRPGAEIKEGLIPVNMIFVSQSINDKFSVEGFYQLDWKETVVDNCGTFFATDTVASGCINNNTVGPNVTANPAAVAGLTPFGIELTPEGIVVPRGEDNEASDSGQWGVAVRWYEESVDAEFGFFFLNYHSRTPYVSAITGPNTADTNFAPALCTNLGVPLAGCGAFLATPDGQDLASAYRLGTSQYFIDYPEDIELYGLSFSSFLSTGTAISGEISYRPNAPLQLNGVDLILALLGDPNVSPLYTSGEYQIANNNVLRGYQTKDVTQAQVTAIHRFYNVMGASALSIVGEAAVVWVGGLDDGLRFGRDSVFGQGELPIAGVCEVATNPANPQNCNSNGFTSDSSWGYRFRMNLDYKNVLSGLNLTPSLSWSHDVNGYGPSTNPFNEGSKAISLGLKGEYRTDYTAQLSYTDFFDGEFNTRVDRDFLALSLGIDF